MGNHKIPTLTQDSELYIVYHYATITKPLLDLWILALEGGCANVGFLMLTTMHLTKTISPDESIGNRCALT
jgi:hypothetical protein